MGKRKVEGNCIDCGVYVVGLKKGRCQKHYRAYWYSQPDVKRVQQQKNREWDIKNPEKKRHLWRRSTWAQDGIDRDQAEELLASFDGRCGCCGTDDPGSVKGWCIDHRHSDGLLRAIVCFRCNIRIGFIENGKATTHWPEVERYLEFHKSRKTA